MSYFAVFADGQFQGLYKREWQAQRLVDKFMDFNINYHHLPRVITCGNTSTFNDIQTLLYGENCMPVGAPRAIHTLLDNIDMGRFGMTYANRRN